MRTGMRIRPGAANRWQAILPARGLLAKMQNEAGRTLPAALVALAVGAILLAPFLAHVSSRLLTSTSATTRLEAKYAADSGVEFVIWSLLHDSSYRSQLDSDPGVFYPLTPDHTVNGLTVSMSASAVPSGTWTPMASIPGGSVREGADLVYTGGDYIYALRGNNSRDFGRYSISGNSWSALAPIPNDVGEGGALVYTAGDFIYALEGDRNRRFWRYSISGNSWRQMRNTPGRVRDGADLAFGGGDAIYALQGNNRDNYWWYSIGANRWYSLQDAPDRVRDGGALAHTGGNFIYALRGRNSTDFWRYQISGDSWSIMASTPGRVNSGGDLAYPGGDFVYAIRGGNNPDFWRFTGSINSWSELTPAPAEIGAGGAMVFINSTTGYVLRGRNSSDFWRVDITPPQYDISVTAGAVTITARVELSGMNVQVLWWDIA